MKDLNLRNSYVELAAVGLLFFVAGLSIGGLYSASMISTQDVAIIWATLAAAVLGAAIGAVVSFLVSMRATGDALQRDLQERQAHQMALAFRLMVKASLILGDLASLRAAIDGSLERANELGLTHLPLWQRVTPIVGHTGAYEVDAAELSPLVEAKEYDLFHKYVELVMQHNTISDAISQYSAARLEIKKILKRHKTDESGRITSMATKEEMEQLEPYAIELESLISTLRRRLPDLEKMAAEVTFGIGPAMKMYFGKSDFPVFKAAKEGH